MFGVRWLVRGVVGWSFAVALWLGGGVVVQSLLLLLCLVTAIVGEDCKEEDEQRQK